MGKKKSIQLSGFSVFVRFNKPHHWDFPSGPVVKNLCSNARDSSSIPGQGTKIPHAMEQLNPSATTREAYASH